MVEPAVLRSALEHYRRQQRFTAAGLVKVRQAARSAGDVAQIVAAFQVLAARDAAESVGGMLDEQGIESDPQGTVSPDAVAGTASDGRPLESLFAQAGSTRSLELMVVTQIQDAARGAAGLAMTNDYGATGYVRMLNPPSCSRCAVLAGKFFKWNAGFQRHPRCDCRHIPSRENLAGDLRTNPNDYFQSLSAADQDRIFTKSGAQAVRDGADVGKVVNARRDMYQAQNFGVNNNGIYVATNRTADGLLFTTEATTKRGAGFRALNERFVDPGGRIKTRIGGGTRYSQATTVRLMPESIYAIAKDRADAIRLLKLNGFIF